MKLSRRLFALLVCLSLLFSLTACGAASAPAAATAATPSPMPAAPAKEPAGQSGLSVGGAIQHFGGQFTSPDKPAAPAEEADRPVSAGSETSAAAQPVSKENPFFDNGTIFPDYLHYDPAGFYAGCERLENLYTSGEYDEANALYDSLLEELLLACDYRGISYLRNTENPSDEYYSSENEYIESLLDEIINTFSEKGQRILSGPGGDAFRAHVGEDTAQGFEDYDVLDAHQLELLARVSELVNEYYEKSELPYTISISYMGKEWTYDSLMEYAEQSDFDYNVLIGAYSELMRVANEELGAIYLELVQLRTEYARSLGYDNYIAMADEDYGRDYDLSAAEPLKEQARRLGYYVENYYSYFQENLPTYEAADVQELLQDAGSVIGEVSPLAKQVYAGFLNDSAYSIGTEDERLQASYTSKFYTNSHPFIYSKTSLAANDLTTICHEFGHYMNFALNEDPDILFSINALDLEEIHSNGLQMLASEYLDARLATGSRDEMSYYGLNCMNMFYQISQGCLYDDWQRSVYENPDMTLDEMNELFRTVNSHYGYSDYPGMEYEWMLVNHNFDSPLYYFSYAVSSYAVLQIFLTAMDDYDGAVAIWEGVLSQGAYNVSVEEVFENAGLTFIDKENDAKVIYRCLDTWFYDVEE